MSRFVDRRPRVRKDPDDPFVEIKVFMPKGLHDKLKEHSDTTGVPISRAICYAVYNELETENPFELDIAIPKIPYVENAFTDEARKIYKYLMLFGNKGTSIDFLVLGRFQMKIADKRGVLLGYRELLEADMIELIAPNSKARSYTIPYVRCKGLDQKKLDAAREQRIARQEAKIKEYQDSLRQLSKDNIYGKED